MTDLLSAFFGQPRNTEQRMSTEKEQAVMPGIEGGLFVWITRPGGSASFRQQERVRSLRTAHGIAIAEHHKGRYVLTHVASGLAISDGMRADKAKHVFGRILSITDWTEEHPRVIRDDLVLAGAFAK
jgi:hypothetical protein